jgi:hypothetical protein
MFNLFEDRAALELACSHNQPGERSSLPTRNCGDGQHFVVRADEKLTAFVELEWQLAVKGMAF